MKTLFLAWQDKTRSRAWYPVGRLDVGSPVAPYRFRYTQGAQRAQGEAGFPELLDFPRFMDDYHSERLFPIFQNRVITPGRPDFDDYLRHLDLPENADPVEILTVDGGYRATDAFEVFPKIEKRPDGSFRCRFFLHGWSHVREEARERVEHLTPGEPLYVTLEITNPVTGLAVQIQTQDYCMLGWAPRYLVSDLMKAMAESSGEYAAHVVRINPQPAPAKQRVLIEFSGQWKQHEPMSAPDFQPMRD